MSQHADSRAQVKTKTVQDLLGNSLYLFDSLNLKKDFRKTVFNSDEDSADVTFFPSEAQRQSNVQILMSAGH